MRTFVVLTLLLGLGIGLPAQTTGASCTGLCLQQVSCTSGITTISGIVYAPNGTDPLPNVTVYIPNAAVDAFTPGVSCPVVGQPPSGSPLVGTTTGVDGSFTLGNVPVGVNIPLVIQSGRWRRQVVVPATTACTNTAFSTRFPQNQTEGDIPKFAIATGAVDQVECILRKVGIADSEFTDPTGSGRINLFTGSGGPGSSIDSATPTQASLMETATSLNQYDVLMLPCQGTPNNNYVSGALGTQELANFIAFANAGGRVYSSHYSYAWMYNNPPFNGVANWAVNSGQSLASGAATVNTGFSGGQTLSNWLELVGASTTPGQIDLSTIKHDLDGVIAPTQSWLTLNTALGSDTAPVMQMVFDTPIGATNQCGRVLFNEYHVENGSSSPTQLFPSECSSASTPMTPQEKLLEYSLFELTDEGGQPTLSPTSASFGNQAVSFTSAAQIFSWTNNSSFPSSVLSTSVTGNFSVTSNNCATVAAGASCQINVVFIPASLGALEGTLTVVSSGNTLTAALTGTGVSDFSLSGSTLNFGNLDIGASATQSLTLTNNGPGALSVPGFATMGDFSVVTACPAILAAAASCPLNITFKPTATGTRTGTVATTSNAVVATGLNAALTGNGVDFSISISPASGSIVAGNPLTATATLAPIAGFAAPIAVTCATTATASTCTSASTTVVPAATLTISITTTSKYTIVGYSGFGGRILWLVSAIAGLLLWRARRRVSPRLRSALLLFVLAAAGLSLSGCSGKLPALNAAYTAPGTYTYTLTATDGFLTHTATYTLTVSAT